MADMSKTIPKHFDPNSPPLPLPSTGLPAAGSSFDQGSRQLTYLFRKTGDLLNRDKFQLRYWLVKWQTGRNLLPKDFIAILPLQSVQEAGSTALSVNKGIGEGTFSDSKHTVHDYAKDSLVRHQRGGGLVGLLSLRSTTMRNSILIAICNGGVIENHPISNWTLQ